MSEVIDYREPEQFAALIMRIQARRVAQCYQGAGREIPPGAAALLRNDTEEAAEMDAAAFKQWCRDRSIECVRVLGISEFADA